MNLAQVINLTALQGISSLSLSRGMSDELTRHMSDLCVWVSSFREEAPDAAQSVIDGGDTDGAF